MKNVAIIGLLSLCATGAYAQGTLQFWDNFSDLQFQVYSQGSNPIGTQGDTAAQGAISGVSGPYITYTGTPIGGSLDAAPSSTLPPGTINYADGNDFTAQIYASPAGTGSGAIPAFSSLSPVSQYITTFQTSGGSANAFLFQPEPANDPGIPGTGYDGSGLHSANGIHILNNANVAVAAWYNADGTITSLAQAISDNVPQGESAVVIVNGLGEPSSVENAGLGGSHAPSSPPEPYGLESFNIATVPEPGTIALGLVGVCGFLARRKK
jgi:hypothetical protein